MTRLLLAAVVCAVATPAAADESTDAPVEEVPADDLPVDEDLEPVYIAALRDPWRLVIGFDFGLGVIDAWCENCRAIGGLDAGFFAGVQVTRRVALMGEVWSVVHLLATDGDETGVAAHTLFTAAARVWVVPRLWIEAGAGAGWLGSAGTSDDVTVGGPAALLGIGGEPGHRRCGGIDLSLRFGGSLFDDDAGGGRTFIYNIGAGVGYHWN